MKKKRSESKSSNAKNGGGSGGSNNDPQHAGSSSSSSSNANTANNALHDKHHNLSSPCSNLAAAIAQEIFPTITTTSIPSAALSSSSSRMRDGAIINENDCLDHPNGDSVMSSGIKKSKAGKHMPPPPSSSEEEEQPLLGYMIRRYLLEERIKAREAETAAVNNSNNSGLKANGGNSIATITATTTTTSTSIKKKKGKKKKKKKGSIPTTMTIENGGEDMNENIIITEEQHQQEQHNNDSGEEENECHPQHSSSSSLAAAVLVGKETPSTSTVASSHGNTTSTAPTAATTTSKQSRSYSGLDRLLDSILESEQQSSHSAILENMDNNSTHHHERRTREGYEMRTMESFSAYLRRKFELHVEHTVHQQQSLQQKKEKFKGGGGGGGVIAATTSTSSKCPKMKNSILRCGGVGSSTALIDILPTISFKDVNDLVEKSIDCRKCRTSVTSRLRNLTTATNNNNTSSTTTKDTFFPSPEGVEFELTNTTSTMMKQHPAIILNERSASILRSTSTPASVAKAAATNGHGLSIPVSGLFSEEDDIDSAFSYVNMDEVDLETGEGGGGGDFEKEVQDGTSTDADANAPQFSSFHLELYPITEKNVGRYLQMTATGKTKTEEEKKEGVDDDDDNGTTSEQEYPMQTNDMINLVKYILLPCGLAQNVLGDANNDLDDTSERYHLSSDDLSAIANEAFAYVNPIQSTVFRMAQSMNSIDEIMEQADHSNNRSIMDSMTPQLLKKADDKIEMLLKQVGDVIFQLFKAICSVGWSSKRGPKLLRFANYLWERHTAALESLIGPTLQHRGNLLRGGGGDRLVPLAYSDIPVRNSLYQLMKAKTVALRTLVLEFSAIIKGDGESSPSALTEIFVLRAFREHVERAKEAAVDKVFPDQESEELLHHLIAAQIHLSQTTIITPLCSGIVKKAKEYRDTLDGLCRKMRKIIIAMEDFAPETKIEFLRRGYETNESSYYDLVKSHNSLCHTDAGFDAKDTAMLLKISVNLVMQWLILLCSRQYHESSMKSLVLPSRLEKWLNSTTGTNFPNFMPNDIKVVVDECDGRGGERRISSILAGLLYRWLEARCSEWHAELTRDELLQSMDMEEAVLVNAESSKVGKKKKSKRKAGGDSSKRMDKIETNDVGEGSGHGVVDLKRVELDPSSNEATDNTLEGRIEFEGEVKIHVECGIDEDLEQRGSIDAHQLSPNVSIEMASSMEACNSKCEYYYPCVGVVDGQQFVTAEMFLVNRLQVILGERADSIAPVSLA